MIAAMNEAHQPKGKMMQTTMDKIQAQYAFITEEDAAALLEARSGPSPTQPWRQLETRYLGVLVRCGGQRFKVNLGHLAGRIAEVEASGDYVRDVSVPVGPPWAWGELGYSHPR